MVMSLPTNHQVLVADDEADVVNLVTQSLSAAGFQVTRACDGQDALDKARRIEPALVVLDLMMPKLTGTEVLRALKSDPRTAAIAVVMLTARKEEVDRIVSLELGADDYVTKPFSPRELTLRVKSILFSSLRSIARFAVCHDRQHHDRSRCARGERRRAGAWNSPPWNTSFSMRSFGSRAVSSRVRNC
jgi:DNA-binding response OmpR family regulator